LWSMKSTKMEEDSEDEEYTANTQAKRKGGKRKGRHTKKGKHNASPGPEDYDDDENYIDHGYVRTKSGKK